MIRTVILIVCLLVCASRADAQQSETTQTGQAAAPQPISGQFGLANTFVIDLDASGPVAVPLKQFDSPFLLAIWMCGTPVPPPNQSIASAAEAQFYGMYQSRDLLNACRATLRTPPPQFLVLLRNVDAAATLRVRLVNAVDSRCRDTIVREWPLGPGEQRAMNLGSEGLRNCDLDDRLEFLVLKVDAQGEQPVGGFALTYELPTLLQSAPFTSAPPPAGSTCPQTYTVEVQLDATGVASSRFRNPRWPPYLGPDHTVPGVDEVGFQRCTNLVFTNRLIDRRLVVTFTGIKPAKRWELLGVPRISTRCDAESCTASLLVVQGVNETGLRVSVLRSVYVDEQKPQSEPVTFNVAFFDDDREPTNARGYFSLVQFHQMLERKSAARWSTSASADLGVIPDLAELDSDLRSRLADLSAENRAHFSQASPTVRPNDWRMQGAVRVTLRQNLGSRANGEFELRLKSGEFGGADPTVVATKYRADVFALHGIVLSAGRFVVAGPAEVVAVTESGDNVGVRWGSFAVNHIFRKQVRDAFPDLLDPKATQTDRDHFTTVAQVNGVVPPRFKQLTFDFYGTIGRRTVSRSIGDKPELPASRIDRDYWTTGLESSLLFLRSWRWNFSGYVARVASDYGDGSRTLADDSGEGWVTLNTLTYTNFDRDRTDVRQAVDFTAQGRFGIAAEDDLATGKNEGYVGESNAFAPDMLFLSALAPAFEANKLLRKGLSNKTYVGAVFTRPIPGVAPLVRLPRSEVGAVSASLSNHWYWLRGATTVAHFLGAELNGSVTAETPRGVRTTISAAYFHPGKAVTTLTIPATVPQPVLDNPVWSLLAQVVITLQ